jgi:hypothetical protein
MVAGSQFVKKPGDGSVSRRAVPARWDGPWSCHLAPARRVFHHRAEYRLPSVSARVGEMREKKHCHRANPLRLPSKESPSCVERTIRRSPAITTAKSTPLSQPWHSDSAAAGGQTITGSPKQSSGFQPTSYGCDHRLRSQGCSRHGRGRRGALPHYAAYSGHGCAVTALLSDG